MSIFAVSNLRGRTGLRLCRRSVPYRGALFPFRGYTSLPSLSLSFSRSLPIYISLSLSLVEAQPYRRRPLLEFLHQLVQNTPAQQNGRRTFRALQIHGLLKFIRSI